MAKKKSAKKEKIIPPTGVSIRASLNDMIGAAEMIEENWEDGDLAHAVHNLVGAADSAKAALTAEGPKTLVRSPRGMERREVPLDEVVVPDLWHIINDRAIPARRREEIRECWRLCHDLLEHARGV